MVYTLGGEPKGDSLLFSFYRDRDDLEWKGDQKTCLWNRVLVLFLESNLYIFIYMLHILANIEPLDFPPSLDNKLYRT